MMTVHEVSDLTGVSIRTLHHYDHIGLLPATEVSPAGYRLYDEQALERLQIILLFRALEFPLKDIRVILDNPSFDKEKALEQQIHLLELRREHLENLIDLARGIQAIGVKPMTSKNFEPFDTRKIDEYAAQAKASWGQTPEYREYVQKSAGWTKEEQQQLHVEMMGIFAEFGKIRTEDPAAPAAQALVAKLQSFITEHFYTCSDQILHSLGEMYAGGGQFTRGIDRVGGEGTAEFAYRAIDVYCSNRLQ